MKIDKFKWQDNLEVLLSTNIYYSPEAAHFFRVSFDDLGNSTAIELPTSLNVYFHLTIEKETLLHEFTSNVQCVGRHFDDAEEDESESFEFEAYYSSMLKIEFNEYMLASLPSELNSASQRLSNALSIISQCHAGQKRKSDDHPYINHLIEVHHLLVSANVKDEDIIIASLLHDVIEDSSLTKVDLVKGFGNRVANLVCCNTEDKTLSLEERRKSTLTKLSTLPHAAKVIKFADICSNVTHIPKTWDMQKLFGYLQFCDAQAEILASSNQYLFNYYTSVRSKVK
jgi:hypothetical protein